MAYPTISAPYGFKPINRFDGIPYAGATLQYPVTSGQAIYNGDTVKLVAGGTISQSGATTTGTIIGVFVGCQYVNSSGQTVQAQYCPASGVTNPIAYVVVDPVAEFKVAVTTTGNTTVVTGANATIIGTNVAQTAYAAGSTSTGDSIAAVVLPANANGNATTLPFRVVAVVPDTAYANATGTIFYPEVIVKINNPQLTALTGVDYTA
jgi:hypothetical protein